LLGGGATGGSLARRISIFIAIGIAAYTVPFEVYAWAFACSGSLSVVSRSCSPGSTPADHLYAWSMAV
jgi:hypothetical protein